MVVEDKVIHKEQIGKVYLPVPGSVTDSNNVELGCQIKWIQQNLLLLILSLRMFKKEDGSIEGAVDSIKQRLLNKLVRVLRR